LHTILYRENYLRNFNHLDGNPVQIETSKQAQMSLDQGTAEQVPNN
jgi:hypothetical protein